MEKNGETEGWYLIKSPNSTEAAINSMRLSAEIEYAEPNYIYYHSSTNDPYYTNGSLWGMYGNLTSPVNAFGSQAGEKYPMTTGSNQVYIGVIE